ncbi:hypothetical protein [Actinomadura sp. WMMA1423]|uniref:hypothetical protein n=1 Tax=Actinomadura sp. WMMA1423 TaxID=2591108 RepID=UPI001146FE1A|nr:hypothetical protein [Actinomadura sp. WMMA1423]
MNDATPQPTTDTRQITLTVITTTGEMTTATATLPLPQVHDLVTRAEQIGKGDQQIVLTVPRPGMTPRVVVRSRSDADAVAGLVAAMGGDL